MESGQDESGQDESGQSGQEEWRQLTTSVRDQFMAHVGYTLNKRQQQGRAQYGDVFVGDPLDQAEEELIDALFYIWMVRRQRDANYE